MAQNTTTEPEWKPTAEKLVEWLTRKELADRWKMPRTTLDQWAYLGFGPAYAMFGRHARYRMSDVIRWENEQFNRDGVTATQQRPPPRDDGGRARKRTPPPAPQEGKRPGS